MRRPRFSAPRGHRLDLRLRPPWRGRRPWRELLPGHADPPGRALGPFSRVAKFATFCNFWRARSRLYQNEILQENMRLTAFFKIYKICIL